MVFFLRKLAKNTAIAVKLSHLQSSANSKEVAFSGVALNQLGAHFETPALETENCNPPHLPFPQRPSNFGLRSELSLSRNLDYGLGFSFCRKIQGMTWSAFWPEFLLPWSEFCCASSETPDKRTLSGNASRGSIHRVASLKTQRLILLHEKRPGEPQE